MHVPEDLIWPAIRIVSTICDPSSIALGQSRFGGLPDVPASFEWPYWRDRPLAFLAQVNLADVARFECTARLPHAGWLLFFYDPEQEAWGFDPADRGCSQVTYLKETMALVRCPLPDAMPDSGRFIVAALTFSQTRTKPDRFSPWVDTFDLDGEREKALLAELDAYADALGESVHQIGGHPVPVQNEMETECQLVTHGIYCGNAEGYESDEAAALRHGASDWRCLLQLDSDDDVGWMWGDAGRIYFWMTEKDIAERRFENAWLILQCG